MHALAKMVRILKDHTERPIEPMMAPFAIGEVLEGEEIKIRLWHGTCLEAEATVTVSEGKAIVKLVPKKELRIDAPAEAV